MPGALHVPSGQPALWLGSRLLWAPLRVQSFPLLLLLLPQEGSHRGPCAAAGNSYSLRSSHSIRCCGLWGAGEPALSSSVLWGSPGMHPGPSWQVPRPVWDGWTDGSWDSTTSLWQVCLPRPASCRLPAWLAPEHEAAGLGGKPQWANALPPGSCAHARPGCHLGTQGIHWGRSSEAVQLHGRDTFSIRRRLERWRDPLRGTCASHTCTHTPALHPESHTPYQWPSYRAKLQSIKIERD